MNNETYMTPAERAFAGEADERLSELVDEAAELTPARKKELAEAKLDDALGIQREPTAAERAEAAESRAAKAEARLKRVAREYGYSDTDELLEDVGDDDNDQ